ncbi:hypothetical protein COCON_G00221220 [Conger conger]|uniref:Uncharacterized protein n=1 Tax=Conger conger TaxID=82655 RepID=A0A9Q1HKJ7_CONCO|nr:hypothetical protein COCON_G00221220 [Conger conger]
MKSEQVTFSSSPNPLLAGLRHYAEASPPAVVIVKSPVPDTSSCAGDTDLRPRPQIPPDAHQGAPPDLPLQSPLTLVDRELQEAFQECEEHMASLLVPRPAAAAPPNDEADRRLSVPPPEGEDVGPLKNKSATGGSELSALPPGALTNQDRGEPNSGTQTAEPLTAKREVETFSFRDYILGLTGEGEEGEIAGKQQPPAGSRTGGPHPPVTAPETPHQAATEGRKNDKNAPATSVTVVEIDRSREGCGGGGGGGGEGPASLTDQESGRSGKRGCVGEEGALEEASVAAGSALPLTTPTMPGMIECEGEEGRAAKAQAGGGDGAAESGEPQSPANTDPREPQTATAAGRPDVPLISTETVCSPERKIGASGSEMPAGCCTRTPRNSEEERERDREGERERERERKGGGGLQSHSPGTEGEGEREREGACVRTDDHGDISPASGPLGHSIREEREVGREGERVIGEGEGDRKEGREEQILSRQTAELVAGGAVTDTATVAAPFPERLFEDGRQTGPPRDVGGPVAKQQHGDEIIILDVDNSAEKGSHLQPIRQRSACGPDPLPSLSPLLHTEAGHHTAHIETTVLSCESVPIGAAQDAVITRTQEAAGPQAVSVGVETTRDPADSEKASLLSTPTRSAPSQPPIGPQNPPAEGNNQQVPLSRCLDIQKEPQSAENSVKTSDNMRDTVRGRTQVAKKMAVTEVRKDIPPQTTGDASTIAPGGCSSLPPLTVHESLHHPVTECSSTLQEFSALQKQEPSVGPALGTTASTVGPPQPTKQSSEAEGERKAEGGGEKVPSQGDGSKEAKEQFGQLGTVGMVTEKSAEGLRAEEEGGGADGVHLLPAAECQVADPPKTEQRAKVTAGAEEAPKPVGAGLSGGPSSAPTEKVPKVTTGDSGRSVNDISLQETCPQASLGSGDSAEIDRESDSPGADEKPLNEPASSLPAPCLGVDDKSLTDATTASPQTPLPVQLERVERSAEVPETSTAAEPESPAPGLEGPDPALPKAEGDTQPWFLIRPPMPLFSHLELTVDCDVTAVDGRETQRPAEEGEGLVHDARALEGLAKQARPCDVVPLNAQPDITVEPCKATLPDTMAKIQPVALPSSDPSHSANQSGGLGTSEQLSLDQSTSSVAAAGSCPVALSQSDLALPSKTEQRELGLGPSPESRGQHEGVGSGPCVGANEEGRDGSANQQSAETRGTASSLGSGKQPGNFSDQRGNDGSTDGQDRRARIEGIAAPQGASTHPLAPEADLIPELKRQEHCAVSTDQTKHSSPAGAVETKTGEKQAPRSEPPAPIPGAGSSGQRSGVDVKDQEAETLALVCEDKQAMAEVKEDRAFSTELKESTAKPVKSDVFSQASEAVPQVSPTFSTVAEKSQPGQGEELGTCGSTETVTVEREEQRRGEKREQERGKEEAEKPSEEASIAPVTTESTQTPGNGVTQGGDTSSSSALLSERAESSPSAPDPQQTLRAERALEADGTQARAGPEPCTSPPGGGMLGVTPPEVVVTSRRELHDLVEHDSVTQTLLQDSKSATESHSQTEPATALRDAAALPQPEEQDREHGTKNISDLRPLQSLPSPQADLEFRTPTEELAPPLVGQSQSNDQVECRLSLTEAEERDHTPPPVSPLSGPRVRLPPAPPPEEAPHSLAVPLSSVCSSVRSSCQPVRLRCPPRPDPAVMETSCQPHLV